jgi:hypothetical protein
MTKFCNMNECKKKLPLISFKCKCDLHFCDIHRLSEEHNCSYNYYEENQKIMKNNLSSIVYTKKELLLKSI